MTYLLIPILCILAATKVTMQSKFSKTNNSGILDNLFYNGIMFTAVSVIFLPFLLKNGVTAQTVIHGMVMGILSVMFQVFYICAFNAGKVTLTVIINNFSMLIPIGVSYLLFKEPFGIFKIIGTVFALVSFFFNVAEEKNTSKTKNNLKWLLFTALVFFSNGFISVNQKIYSMTSLKLQVFEFVAVAYITAAFLSFSIMTAIKLKKKERETKRQPWIIFSGCLVGALLGAFQCLNTYATSVIDGTVLYPVYNCGTTILMTLVGTLLFKEKLSKKQWTGVCIGVFAIVFLCL